MSDPQITDPQNTPAEAESTPLEALDPLADAQAELANLKAQNADLADQYLRAQADVQNARRRADDEITKARKFAVESFADSLLPVAYREGPLEVTGFAQRPSQAKPAGRKGYVFARGRPIRDPVILRAAEANDNTGNRRRKVRETLFDQLGISDGAGLFVRYAFDWRGPSFTVDTACSSSLVAFSQALSDLRSGRIDTAVVAGVNMLLTPASFIGFSRASMLSPTGLCRPFSADGDGYVRGEGAVAFVLRRHDLAAPGSVRALAISAASDE